MSTSYDDAPDTGIPMIPIENSTLIMLTLPRSGSSWVSSMIADAMPDVLPLFELFNTGFPLAHLNIYDNWLHQHVKGNMAARLVAPTLVDTDPVMAAKLARNNLTALRQVSGTPHSLGRVIKEQPDAALNVVHDISRELGRHGAVSFKLMESIRTRTSQHLEAFLTSLRGRRSTTFLHLRRNAFNAYVSSLKVASCPRRLGYQNDDTTSCKPTIDIDHLIMYLDGYIKDTDEYLGFMGRKKGDDAIFQRPAADWSNGAAGAIPSAALSASYEEFADGTTDPSVALQRLLSRLRAVGYPVPLEAVEGLSKRYHAAPPPAAPGVTIMQASQHEAQPVQHYEKQDKSSSLKDKIANYHELEKFYHTQFRNVICPRRVMRSSCETDPIYQLPP